MSDRPWGLIEAVKEALPYTRHSYYLKHLEAKFKKAYHDDLYLVGLFWKVATTYRGLEFQQTIDLMQEHDPRVVEFWKDAPFERWSSAKFPGKRYGQLTTSIAESCNNVLKGARGKEITNLAEHTRLKATDWANNRRKSCSTWITPVTPTALELILANCECSRQHNVFQVDATIFQVNLTSYQDVVDLDKRICSCGKFQDIGIPCDHAFAAIDTAKLEPHDYVEKFWLADTYKQTYLKPIMPTLDRSQWQPLDQ